MEKTAAAKHSADYRARQAEAKEKLGIEKMSVNVPAGTRSGMKTAMKDHRYSNVQELWQELALSFLSMPLEEQGRRLRKPDTSAFIVTPSMARQLDEAAKREAARDEDE